MGVLKSRGILSAILLLSVCVGQLANADYLPKGPDDKAVNEAKKNLCQSTDEYIKTLKFLRETKEFAFQEQVSRKIAFDVSRGCDGASERFAQILVLIKTVGFSEKKALEMALEFAAAQPDVQKNFMEIFTKSFLQEFFDYEFSKAMKVALELSKNYRGDPIKAREDFLALSKFCRDSKKMGLPVVFCSDYSVRVAGLSQFFEDGVSKPFFELYKQLREKKEFTLDIKLSLEIAYSVLRSGPTAPKNFTLAYEFATTDLKLDKKRSLEFAIDLANHSFVGEEPPVLHFRSALREMQ